MFSGFSTSLLQYQLPSLGRFKVDLSAARHEVFEQIHMARTEAPAGVASRYVEDGRRRKCGKMPKNLCHSSLSQL